MIPEPAIVDELYMLACRGGGENLNHVIKRLHKMNVAEVLLHLQGAFRLQEWIAEALVCRGAGGEAL